MQPDDPRNDVSELESTLLVSPDLQGVYPRHLDGKSRPNCHSFISPTVLALVDANHLIGGRGHVFERSPSKGGLILALAARGVSVSVSF